VLGVILGVAAATHDPPIGFDGSSCIYLHIGRC
jgi:hypothetical protein